MISWTLACGMRDAVSPLTPSETAPVFRLMTTALTAPLTPPISSWCSGERPWDLNSSLDPGEGSVRSAIALARSSSSSFW
ncbi:hypothetical protein [Nocardiopsis halotolerans]|uniref:hypothetical protein n=1 Tax=Nocardiopsis halotolerans TaxID=124252 RepID=UPI0012696075|nr:hypothetical protein [Nocardiopsis halotolerans]